MSAEIDELIERLAYKAYDIGYMQATKGIHLATYSGFLMHEWPKAKTQLEELRAEIESLFDPSGGER